MQGRLQKNSFLPLYMSDALQKTCFGKALNSLKLNKTGGVQVQLTVTEKREFLERIRTLVMQDVIQKEDRDEINLLCIAACEREIAKLSKEGDDE